MLGSECAPAHCQPLRVDESKAEMKEGASENDSSCKICWAENAEVRYSISPNPSMAYCTVAQLHLDVPLVWTLRGLHTPVLCVMHP